jgi:hypothetical protein
MPQFVPDQVAFGDVIGAGAWDDNHHREHQQFVQTLAGQTPPVLFANYDFLSMLSADQQRRRSMFETHQEAHAILAQLTNTQAVDFGQFDITAEQGFYDFLGWHSTVHANIRQALGIV